MPEIWMGYGDSEIILDIKYENLGNNITPNFNTMDLDSIYAELEDKIKLKDSTLILVMSSFKHMIPILEYLKRKSKELQYDRIEFTALSKIMPNKFKKTLIEKEINLIKLESTEVIEKINRFSNVILIDKIEYDPFFGFSGIPTKLLRSSFPTEMYQAYLLSIDKFPQPGIYTEQLKIAVEVTQKTNVEAINIIANKNGINSIFIGDMTKSFSESIKQLNELTQIYSDTYKAAFISGDSNFTLQNTLSDSLNLLWNNYHIVSENGTIILLSENRGGLGNGALQRLSENRLNLAEAKNRYIKDIEHINFLNLLGEKYEIILVSTLPHVYIEKLGLRSISNVQHGLKGIIEKYGKYLKSAVITNSEITLAKHTDKLS